MNKETIAQKFSRFINQTKYEDIDEKTIWRAKMCILDMIGVVNAAWPEKSTQILFNLLRSYGGNPESSVFGTKIKLPAAHAAMVNSTMGHSLELEDHHSHKRSLNHPGICTIPPALAIAEREGKSGKDLLTAVVLGYEIGSRIGAATKLGTLNLKHGFHESSVVGPFSAATVTGKLMGTSEEVLTQAFGICGSLASGSMEFKSCEAWSKRVQVGNASRNGIIAVELAKEGFTGPPTVFEGKHGFYHSYVKEGNYDLGNITTDLGINWDINNIQYKPFACAGVLHSAVTAAQKARELYKINPDQIRNVLVRTSSKLIEEYAIPFEEKIAPKNPVGAQFSLQYSVAVMLVKGKALLGEFSPETISDPDILRVAGLIHLEEDPVISSGWPTIDPTEVIIKLDNDQEIKVRVEEAKGDLNNPVTDEELIAKFKELTDPFLDQQTIEHVIEMCKNIEQLPYVEELIKAFA